MIIPFENQYLGSRLTRTVAVSEMTAIAGTIKSITVIALNVGSLGDFVFNVYKNDVALFSVSPVDNRITINSANKIASKTGLNVATVLGDKLTLKLEAVGAGGLLAPIYCLVSFEDGVSAGSSALDDLTDVAITSPANNDFLQRKSGVFVNRTPAQVKADLDLTGTNSGDQTASNTGASGSSVFKQLSGSNFQFRKLKAGSNVTISENRNDIEISASGGGGGASDLDDLSDVVLTSPASGQVLKFNGTNWVNGTDNTASGGSGAGSSGFFSIDALPFEDVHPLSDDFGDADKTAANWMPFQNAHSDFIADNGTGKIIADPQAADLITGAMKNLPDGNCTIIAKLYVFYPKGGLGIGLLQDAVANPNTSDIMFFGFYRSDATSGSNKIIAPKLTDYQSFTTAVFSDVTYDDSIPHIYIRLSRADTTWTYSYSASGRKWETVGTFTEGSQFKPKQFGLIVDNASTASGNITGFFQAEMLYFFDRDGAELPGGLVSESRISAVENQVQFLGDSITQGYALSELKSFPHQLATLKDAVSIGFSGRVLSADDESQNWKVINRGYNSYTTQNIIDKILPNTILRRDLDLTRDVVVVFAGTNDIGAGANAATVYGRLTTIISNLQAEGFEVFVCTIIDRNDLGGGFDTTRAALNTLINANSAGADGVIDLFADARLTDASNATYFQVDTLHTTAAGNAVIAELIEAVL